MEKSQNRKKFLKTITLTVVILLFLTFFCWYFEHFLETKTNAQKTKSSQEASQKHKIETKNKSIELVKPPFIK
jgi:regulatory protein YycH of two-component signal transduction system YycFG